MRPQSISFRLAVLVSVAMLATAAFAQATTPSLDEAKKDPILRAMLEELERSRTQLHFEDWQHPFFIQYRLDDMESFEAEASYGALTRERVDHRRIVRVTVRVGDYKTDSSALRGERGDGSLQIAAVEDDPVALRSALWSATDTAYKSAIRDFTQKSVMLKSFQTVPEADDFSREQPVVTLEPVLHPEIDREEWKHRIIEASGLYRTDADAKKFAQETQYSSSDIHARVVNRYLVNTEGTVVRQAFAAYQGGVSVGSQAADGLHLDRSYATTGTIAAQLDSPEAFRRHAIALLLSLHELRNAPPVSEEYHGPVLFLNDAATDLVNSIFAGAVSGNRPDPGTTARTSGPYASSYRARVLPELFDVVDDPTMKSFAGRGLVGAYEVDDEGVPAQAVKVVERGKLINYLLGRQPIRNFPHSNGHGRAPMAGGPAPHFAVLRVEAAHTQSREELEKKLLATGKERDLEWVYEAETLGPELTPRLLYRIHVADGKRELVRDAVFDELDTRSLRSEISAVGNDDLATNYAGEIPSTVIAPSLLFDEIAVKAATEKRDKLPYYPPPAE
jgi:predicted Zn-dependent protease